MNRWPRYFVSRTLIGGDPDCNARFIHRGADGEEVWRRKPGAGGWSKEDEAATQAELRRLLDGVALTSMEHPPGLIDKMADAIRNGKLKL